jgi:hypothetical protein
MNEINNFISFIDYLYSLEDDIYKGKTEAKVDLYYKQIEKLEVVKGKNELLFDKLESIEVVNTNK